MQYKFSGTNWLKGEKSFEFPGLFDYVQETKRKLSEPLKIPEYATAQEEEWIKAISEKAKDNPYLNRTEYAEAAKRKDISDLRTISYGEYPSLYNICMFASQQLAGVNPVIFMYSSKKTGSAYNASALDYMDRVWIYISDQFVKERGMMRDEELCFLIGHELGHAQCHHSTIASSGKDSSDAEYSADRAGMIVCTKWLMANNPDLAVEEAIKKAMLYGTSALVKIGIGHSNGLNNTSWDSFSYDDIQSMIDSIFDDASKHTLSRGTHPKNIHRIMAMDYFSESELLYRCLGLDTQQYRHLSTDAQLNKSMAHILKKC